MFLGKKARTFDLEAMFEQTRRTAVERSRKVLGKELGGADALAHPKMRFAFFLCVGVMSEVTQTTGYLENK